MNEQKFVVATIEIVDSKGVLPEIQDLVQKLGASKDEVAAFKKSKAYDKLKISRSKFSKERQKGFKSFANFYKWHSLQEPKCHYCGTSQDELDRLFQKSVSSKKFSATLHIERKHPDKGYNADNCVLACSLCNNAKSDMISEANFKQYFAKSIRNFVSDLLDGKITNQI